ncbi:hypothetical protein [Streptomyces sp. NPDC007206]|uniref:hypothetical protein n=1 Tax=Streptomyces sp. NPDC007206 TaxID=3154317 RepID=UPI0033F40979
MALDLPIKPMLAEPRRASAPRRDIAGAARRRTENGRVPLHPLRAPDLVMVQSRQGTDLTSACPDIADAATELSEALMLDGGLLDCMKGDR